MQKAMEEIAVWTVDEGRPVRVVWRGERYRVNDRPTLLAEALIWWHPAVTHPIPPEGWRFQAVSESTGIARVFDIQEQANGRWDLLRVYD